MPRKTYAFSGVFLTKNAIIANDGCNRRNYPTLLIMAAGIGSRFGGGIKQLEPVDEQNHIIMDYYGKEGFRAVHEYLVEGGKSCMAGFVLKNTLSDNGAVTRGVCKMDADNNLTEVCETKNIVKTADGAEVDGKKLDVDSLVSMNMWGLTPDFGELLAEGKMAVKVLRSNDTWYGMTYKEDVAAVKESFREMLADGTYQEDLYSDL